MEQGNPVAKRAFEIAYAMFRVASGAGNIHIKDSLERFAVRILELATQNEPFNLCAILQSAEYVLRLGANVGVIHSENEEAIIRALHDLSRDAEREADRSILPVRLEDILTERGAGQEQKIDTAGDRTESNPAIRQKRESNSLKSSGERQAAIFHKIRQNGTCRLKDIQDILPEVSERTLRYDIEYLIGHGMIERFGSGGPATYYRPREGLQAIHTP